MNYSFWEQDTFINSIDVAIIGGGIVGLSAAIYLKMKKPELKVVVLEQGVVLSGASLRNAGFACFGSPSELLSDLETRSTNEVFQLVEDRLKGLQQLRSLLGDSVIEYAATGGYEVFEETDKTFDFCIKNLPEFNKQLHAITCIKETYKVNDQKLTSFGFKGFKHLIEIGGEAQINTGKMMQAFMLKATTLGVIILNGVKLLGYEDNESTVVLNTSWQTLKTKRLLFATNGYTSSLLKNIDVKPARAQVLITSPIKELKVKGNFHFDGGYYYFRNVGNRILLGGGRNLDIEKETTTEPGITTKIQTALEKILSEKILPSVNYTIENRWSGVMGVGATKSPIVDKLSTNVFCAVRMGGMGVALGTGTGQKVASLVLNSL
jgi:gamma-glutamylputrescine oxidase